MSWSDVMARTEQLVSRIAYKPGYRFVVRQETGPGLGRPYVQVKFDRLDPETAKPSVGHSERRYLPEHADDTKLARLLFDLVRDAEDREAHRSFRVDGRRVYSLGLQLDDLIAAADAHTAPADPDPAPSPVSLLFDKTDLGDVPSTPTALAAAEAFAEHLADVYGWLRTNRDAEACEPTLAPRSLADSGCAHKRTRGFPRLVGDQLKTAHRCLDCDAILAGAS